MSDHTKAIVPLHTWLYASPDLEGRGQAIDIGLFTEALIYYDQVWVQVENNSHFIDFVSWFINRDQLETLVYLIEEEAVKFYVFAFSTNPLVTPTGNNLYNLVFGSMNEPNYFQNSLFEDESFAKIFPNKDAHERFCKIISDKFIEGKADNFATAIDNAKADYDNLRRRSFMLQSLLNELYLIKKLGTAPLVYCELSTDVYGRPQARWNRNLQEIAEHLGFKDYGNGITAAIALDSFPLSGAGITNRLLMAAMQNYVDLYLPNPLSIITGDKLYEASQEEVVKTKFIVEAIQGQEVDFPDLRHEINDNNLDFKEVLLIRKKGEIFRKWLQEESERDRDALIAYHHEVAKATNFKRKIGKTLQLFGDISGSVASAVIGAATAAHPEINPMTGKAIAALTGHGIKYLGSLGNKLGEEWRPVVFGKWYTKHIGKINQFRNEREALINPLGITRAQRRQEELRLHKIRKRLSKKQP